MSTASYRKPRRGQRAPSAKSGHVPIRQLDIEAIRPSPENDRLYRPVDPNAPDIRAMAQSIREHGLREPLTVTRDRWILSGHRRYAAAKLAGLPVVPCIVAPFSRQDDLDNFVVLLREHNRQRVKSLDEQLREEVATCNPDEAYQSLIDYRRHKSAECAIDGMVIPQGRRRAAISAAKLPFLRAVQAVMADRRQFWPLSDRQIHYALLNDPPLIHASKRGSLYANNSASYKALVDLLTRARLQELVPMEAIADETRPVVLWGVHRGPQEFVREELGTFLKGYWRDLMRSQPNHIEIIAEKNTVAPILKPVAAEYCIPLTSGRGYCSLPPRAALSERFRNSGKERLVLLIVSDFDPDGEMIAESFARSLRDDFEIGNVDAIKVALTAAQVAELDLPPAMQAKTTSANYAKFKAMYGDDVYELEAVPPETLQTILREAIDRVIDIDLFNVEIDQEKADAAFLQATRRTVKAALSQALPDWTDGNGDE